MKPQKPGIAFFAAQFASLLVGEGKHFSSFGDLCRWANNECGLTGVSMPVGMLDVPQMIQNADFRGSVLAEYASYGTPIIRLESHVVGQLVCVHPALLQRWVGFIPPELQGAPVHDVQSWARERMLEVVELSRLLGFEDHQTFPGGRSVPLLTDPWPAHADGLYENSLAYLARCWEPILQAASGAHLRIGFEIRHIMEDIATVPQLIDFSDMLADDAASAAAWGVDVSHYEIDGDDPLHDLQLAIERGLVMPGHAKQGYFDESQPGHCRRPANMPWSERAGKFCTFGTHNPNNSREWVRSLMHAHHASTSGLHAVIEGECMFLRNPLQGMRVAAANLRQIMDGHAPTHLSQITPEPWDGPAFDSFAETGVKATELLGLWHEATEDVGRRVERFRAKRT